MPNQLHPTTQQYRAYTAATQTVGKVRQIVMLYDGAIRFVQQAVEAIGRGDYETRFNLLVKTSAIIDGLQNSLDFENGGDVSKLLYDYYASMDARLFSVHRSNDVKVCESVIKELKLMRSAWDEIDQAHARLESEQRARREHTPARMMSGSEEASGIGVSA